MESSGAKAPCLGECWQATESIGVWTFEVYLCSDFGYVKTESRGWIRGHTRSDSDKLILGAAQESRSPTLSQFVRLTFSKQRGA